MKPACLLLLLALASGASAHVPSFAGLSASPSRIVDAPHKARVSQVLYGKLLPGQQLCLRAAEPAESYYEVDFVSAEAGTFRGSLTFSLHCDGAAGATAGAPSACASDLPGKVEPFTQSAYHSVMQSTCGSAYLNSSTAASLSPTLSGSPRMLRPVCPPGDRIRACLQAPSTATGVVLGGIVVGREETFCLRDLASFPLYVARLHGSYGNRDYVLHYIAVALVAIAFLGLLLRGGLPLPREAANPKDGIVVVYMLRQAAGFFLLAAVDACYHAGRVADKLSLSGDGAWELVLFMLLVVGVAQLIPMALCLRFAHTGFQEPGYCSDALPVFAMVALVDASLFMLGTELVRIAVIATASCTLLAALVAAWLKRPAVVLAVLLAHLCLGLLFFLGSGYWIGPSFLAMALLFSLIRCPEQWWPPQCPCRRHSIEMRGAEAVL